MVLVFGVGHLRALDDVLDDGFTIKYGKMMVIPGGYGGIALLSMDGVDMGTFIESDELVTGVCVLDGEHLLRSKIKKINNTTIQINFPAIHALT